MKVGFLFWPFTPDLVRAMAGAADRYGYDMIGIADTPGNAMDPWVAATMVAEATAYSRIALCVTNLVSRHPAVSAGAIASLDLLAPGRVILGLGAGHSGTRNLGISSSAVGELDAGTEFIRTLLTGAPASWRGGAAQLPWAARRCPVFLAASGPRALDAAGRSADGAFINYGLREENLAQSQAAVRAAAEAAGRDPQGIEIWQMAALDCNRDGEAARRRVGAILAFMAAGYVLRGNLTARGVPDSMHGAVAELKRRYSTRPGDADAVLVDELGLFDYLSGRFAIYGTPAQCGEQLRAARSAGLERIMLTVSLASDPLGTVELFGSEVLPALRR
jgi:5,10-methylenetetrahydromethanopterin reductase